LGAGCNKTIEGVRFTFLALRTLHTRTGVRRLGPRVREIWIGRVGGVGRVGRIGGVGGIGRISGISREGRIVGVCVKVSVGVCVKEVCVKVREGVCVKVREGVGCKKGRVGNFGSKGEVRVYAWSGIFEDRSWRKIKGFGSW
jgi:hypothetical protein